MTQSTDTNFVVSLSTEKKEDVFYIPLVFLFYNNENPFLLENANYKKQ